MPGFPKCPEGTFGASAGNPADRRCAAERSAPRPREHGHPDERSEAKPMTAHLGYNRNKFVYPPKIGVIDEPIAFIPILAEKPEYPIL